LLSGQWPVSYQPKATPWVHSPVLPSQANGLLHKEWVRWALKPMNDESRLQRSQSFLGAMNPGRCLWTGMNDAFGVANGRAKRLHPVGNPTNGRISLLSNPDDRCAFDRVGCRGFRPRTLPHHRTCGFPHTAVGLLRVQTSYIAELGPRHSAGLQRLLRSGLRLPVPDSDRSCRVWPFRLFVSPSFQMVWSCAIVLRPFARNAFLFVRSSNATMASADFPALLSARISPGQCLFFPFAPLGSTECRQ
jgi:hypothetical protein